MSLKADKLFRLVWPLAVLALPWQTRYFLPGPSVAGWPWEQGRLSFYVSWVLVLATIVLGSFVKRRELPMAIKRSAVVALAMLGLCTVIAMPQHVQASVQWWVQVMLLASFVMTLLLAEVTIEKFLVWTAVSLVPHAVLALMQFFSQEVLASVWLGISAQDPAVLGVSVVQTATARVLRAYGGFPHPNILGGWITVGLVSIVWYISNNRDLVADGGGRRNGINRWFIDNREKFLYATLGLFACVLFYSFSRSAWIATACGLAVLTLFSGRGWKRLILPVGLVISVFSVLTIVHWDLVATRTNVSGQARLEQRSVDSRKQSLLDGVRFFQARPFFGTGPNAELPVLAHLDSVTVAKAPLEPPHLFWLLMLVDLGVVGVLVIMGLALVFLRRALDRWRDTQTVYRVLAVGISVSFLVLSIFDHYLWSMWSGQVLIMLGIFIWLAVFEYRGQNNLA